MRAAIAEIVKRGPQQPKVLEDPVPITIGNAPFKGPAKARITLVEFSDFQCPYCAAAVSKLDAVLKMYPNDVRLVFKQFPLDTHPQAPLGCGKQHWPRTHKANSGPCTTKCTRIIGN